jgi:hypothetical protein
VGAVNQWVRVRDEQGHEGFAAAWYLEKGQAVTPAPATAPAPAATPSPKTPASSPVAEAQKLIVVVKSGGAKVLNSASAKGEVLSKEKSGASLVVVEPVDAALPKIGVAGKWLTVKGTNGKRGFVDAGTVKEA